MARTIRKMPLQTTFKFMTNLLVPVPILHEVHAPTPNSPTSAIVPSDAKPFKLVAVAITTIAGWFGVTCEDCSNVSIWGCYITNSCWKTVIVAIGVLFLFIALLMGAFFLGQMDNVLKYRRQLTEFEKSYPTLANVMIFPLKRFHKAFSESYNKSMKSLTKKFGKKPWFRFVVIMPSKCLKGTWTIFQKILQPTCLCTWNCSAKTKKCIADTGFCQWASDKAFKKAGLRDDPEGDKKRAKKAKEEEKQAIIDERNAKKQEKKDEKATKKQVRLEAKAANKQAKQAKIDSKEARVEAQKAKREGRNNAKLDVLHDANLGDFFRTSEEAEAPKRGGEAGANVDKLVGKGAKKQAKIDARKTRREAKEVAKEAQAPPSSPTLPSPPPSPIPPPTMIPQEMMTPITTPPPMVPSPTPTSTSPQANVSPFDTMPPTPFLPSTPQSTVYGIDPNQQYMDPYAAQQYGQPYDANSYDKPVGPTQPNVYGIDPNQQFMDPYATQQYGQPYDANLYDNPIGPNQPTMYGIDPNQQYMDPYATQQYGQPYDATSYYGYRASPGYGANGQEQYGMYSNDPTYVPPQGFYGHDQNGQQAMGYNYNINVGVNAQEQYPQPQYPQPQYNG